MLYLSATLAGLWGVDCQDWTGKEGKWGKGMRERAGGGN